MFAAPVLARTSDPAERARVQALLAQLAELQIRRDTDGVAVLPSR
jgi:hypothetical protein